MAGRSGHVEASLVDAIVAAYEHLFISEESRATREFVEDETCFSTLLHRRRHPGISVRRYAAGVDEREAAVQNVHLQQFLDDCLAHYPIDTKKLAILGFSQGGVMAYSLALANPDRFAALVTLSSWLPPELVPHLSLGNSAQDLPTLVQHGTQDSMIEVDRARRSVETLRQARIPLTYREYEMGHEIRPRSLSDLSAWLDEKVLSPIVLAN